MGIGVNTELAGDGITAKGPTAQGLIQQRTVTTVGGTADISNQASAQSAVGALAAAVTTLAPAKPFFAAGVRVWIQGE